MRDKLIKLLKQVKAEIFSVKFVLRIGLCVGLSAGAIFAVQFIGGVLQKPEPLVDVFQNKQRINGQTSSSAPLSGRLRFAIAAMVSAEETFSTYNQFVQRISRDIGREDAFFVRPSYEDVRLALMNSEVDVALVCTGTYLNGMDSDSIKLLVQPEFEDGYSYRSILLVPFDSSFQTWEDLQDKVIAFTDPESFTGSVLPSAILASRGHEALSYFEKIIYTGSHDRSIMAVSANVVDAATIDSLVWFSKLQQSPSLQDQIRIIWQSQSFGPPPIVVPKNLDRNLVDDLRRAFLSLHEDAEGRSILSAIGIKRFILPAPKSYDSAMKIYKQYRTWQDLQ